MADHSGFDRRYTVFREVCRGLDVLDKLVAVARDEGDNPLEPNTSTVREEVCEGRWQYA